MDFTISIYKKLLEELLHAGYSFQTFELFIESPENRVVVLRHDVDRLPENALKIAKIENEFNVPASYYFRVVNNVWDKQIMKKIVTNGHEIAYHYEDLALKKGVYKDAITHFERQLKRFRLIYPVQTICMHGSPLSSYDNRKLWDIYDYKNYGIIAEPYFDVNFDEVLYLTDTGRGWNKSSVSVRDKVQSNFNYNFNSTQDIINNIEILPDKIMINTHPQRWNDKSFLWIKELVMQSIKNAIKRHMFVKNWFF